MKFASVEQVGEALEKAQYICSKNIATVVFLAHATQKPILVEGPAGVGKTELAKAVAQFEELPEADHNMVAGVVQPESLFGSTMVIFLRASLNHPRNIIRVDATNRILMVEGFGTNVIQARGDTHLAQQWTCLHFGDYTAYYLAMAYRIDPTPVAAIEGLKEILVRAEM